MLEHIFRALTYIGTKDPETGQWEEFTEIPDIVGDVLRFLFGR
jgi:hypothetical protein